MSNLDTSSITSMEATFMSCASLKTIIITSGFPEDVHSSTYTVTGVGQSGQFYYNPEYNYDFITSVLGNYNWEIIPMG